MRYAPSPSPNCRRPVCRPWCRGAGPSPLSQSQLRPSPWFPSLPAVPGGSGRRQSPRQRPRSPRQRLSRNRAFTYRNKPADTRQIGRELGVRYALEGSVQRSGNQVRVNAQLIDATTDAHLWAERFDRDVGDLFVLQNEITSRIANALNIELIAVEAARPVEHPEALDYILRGRAALMKPESRDSYAEAIRLFEYALSLDPQSVEAQISLAGALAARVLTGLSDSRRADRTRADELIGRALVAWPR